MLYIVVPIELSVIATAPAASMRPWSPWKTWCQFGASCALCHCYSSCSTSLHMVAMWVWCHCGTNCAANRAFCDRHGSCSTNLHVVAMWAWCHCGANCAANCTFCDCHGSHCQCLWFSWRPLVDNTSTMLSIGVTP